METTSVTNYATVPSVDQDTSDPLVLQTSARPVLHTEIHTLTHTEIHTQIHTLTHTEIHTQGKPVCP